MRACRVLTIGLVLAFGGAALSSGSTDYSGTWVLDMARSDMGRGPGGAPPGARQVKLVISQTAATLSIERHVGEKPETAVYKLDGSESVNTLPSGKQVRSSAAWAGANLTLKAVAATEAGSSESSFVYSLSPDGKTLTIDVAMKMPSGERKQRLVYARQ
jgi:hypothetical protein